MSDLTTFFIFFGFIFFFNFYVKDLINLNMSIKLDISY